MSQTLISDSFYKTCSSCKHLVPDEGFCRKGKVWKTCNECSANSYGKRKAETSHVTAIYDALDLRMATLRISQQQQFDLMVQQQQFEQQWQQQRDLRMTLDYLLADPAIYKPSPLELYEQHRRLNRQTQEIFSPESSQSRDQQLVTYHNPQPDPLVQLFSAYPPGLNHCTSKGMLPDYELLGPNFYCNLDALANGEQTDYDWSDDDPIAQEIDFEECLVNALRTELFNMRSNTNVQQSTAESFDSGLEFDTDWAETMVLTEANDPCASSYPSILAPAPTDVNTAGFDSLNAEGNLSHTIIRAIRAIQGQPKAAAKRVRQSGSKTPLFSLDAFFADFNASEDILRQPTSSQHNLTGEALAKHLISELGLAIRLSELHHHWNKKQKHNEWFKEVDILDRLEENEVITPWGPLSDWFVLYQNGLEAILDRYGHGSNLDLKTAYKVRADKYALSKFLRKGLREEALRLIEANTGALFKLFVNLTGQAELTVKTALNKQLRLMKAAVARDCATNGILYLKFGPHGTYVES